MECLFCFKTGPKSQFHESKRLAGIRIDLTLSTALCKLLGFASATEYKSYFQQCCFCTSCHFTLLKAFALQLQLEDVQREILGIKTEIVLSLKESVVAQSVNEDTDRHDKFTHNLRENVLKEIDPVGIVVKNDALAPCSDEVADQSDGGPVVEDPPIYEINHQDDEVHLVARHEEVTTTDSPETEISVVDIDIDSSVKDAEDPVNDACDEVELSSGGSLEAEASSKESIIREGALPAPVSVSVPFPLKNVLVRLKRLSQNTIESATKRNCHKTNKEVLQTHCLNEVVNMSETEESNKLPPEHEYSQDPSSVVSACESLPLGYEFKHQPNEIHGGTNDGLSSSTTPSSNGAPAKSSKRKKVCSYEGCGARFRENTGLKVHIRKIHEGKVNPYECSLCHEEFNSRKKLEKHRKEKHPVEVGEKIKAYYKKYSTEPKKKKTRKKPSQTSSPRPRRKLPKATGPGPRTRRTRARDENENLEGFVCDVCGKICKDKSSLRCHKQYHEKKHICDTCGRAFGRRHDLTSHEQVHRPETPYMCEHCAKGFKQHGDLLKHKLRCGENADKLYKCDRCGVQYRNASTLRIHLLQHDGKIKLPFECEVCGHRVRFKSMLEIHRRCHLEEKEYECEFCHEKFKRKYQMTSHVDFKHLGKIRHSCPHCPYQAMHKQILICHLRKHTGERPFQCSACTQAFTASHHLRRHHQRKHGEKKDTTRRRGRVARNLAE